MPPAITHLRRRPAHRAAAASILAVMFSLIAIPQAQAGEQKLTAFASSWFWSSNANTTTCLRDPARNVCQAFSVTGGAAAGTSPGTGSPISFGHLGVAMKDGSSDMRSYIKFDLGELPFGADITSMIVTLKVSDQSHEERHREFLDNGGKPPGTVNARAAGILACAVTEPWGPSEGDAPYSTEVNRPKVEEQDTNPDDDVVTTKKEPFSDCGVNATGRPSSDGKTWTFDITNIAKKWTNLEVFNEGIALHPVASGVSTTWTMEFHGAPLVLASGEDEIEWVTAKEAAAAQVTFFDPPPPPPPPPAGGGGGFVPPPLPDFPTFGDPIVGGTPDTPPPFVPPPAPTGPVVAVGSGIAQTPAWLFALIPLGLLGMGMVSTAIGPPGVAAATGMAGTGNRVASLLHERRLDGAFDRAAEGGSTGDAGP